MMIASFEIAVTYVLNREGGLSENKFDKGGITNYGISLRFLKSLTPQKLKSYQLDIEPTDETIRNITIQQAKALYHGEFWVLAPFESIRSQNICNYVFDMAVNMSLSPAIKCLQRACWSAYGDKSILDEDGILGTDTLRYVNQPGIWEDICAAMRSERAANYRLIISKDSSQENNYEGWMKRAYNNSSHEMEECLQSA